MIFCRDKLRNLCVLACSTIGVFLLVACKAEITERRDTNPSDIKSEPENNTPSVDDNSSDAASAEVVQYSEASHRFDPVFGKKSIGRFGDIWIDDKDNFILAGQNGGIVRVIQGEWTRTQTPLKHDINRIVKSQDNVVWLAGDMGSLAYTDDVDKGWVVLTLDQSIDLLDLTLGSENQVAVASTNQLLYSSDKGKTFEEVALPKIPSDIYLSSSTIWAGFDDGTFAKSEDWGKTWQTINFAINGVIDQIQFDVSGTIGLIASYEANTNQFNIYQSQDSGTSWRLLGSRTAQDFERGQSKLTIVNQSSAFFRRSSRPFRFHLDLTNNQISPNYDGFNCIPSTLGFGKNGVGVLASEFGCVEITTDAATTWTEVFADPEEVSLSSMSFI